MQFEVLHRSKKKKFLIAGCLVVVVLLAIVFSISFAKYRVTKSMQLMTGTINFSPYDFNLVAMYLDKGGALPAGQTEVVPKIGYDLDMENSACYVGDAKDDTIAITYVPKVDGTATPASLSFDHMFSKSNYTVFMFTLRVGTFGVPIWFRCFKDISNNDAFKLNTIQKGIEAVSKLFENLGFNLVFLADRWFGSSKILDIIDKLGHIYAIRLKGNIIVYLNGEKVKVKKLKHRKYHSVIHENVLITDDRYKTTVVYSPTNNTKDPWIIVTNWDPSKALKSYSYRFGSIETMFKAQKSNGFNLEKISNASLESFTTMYTMVCTCILYLTILGADYSKNTRCYKDVNIETHKTYNIDGKKVKKRIMSLFNAGLTLFKRAFNSCVYIRIPLSFKLYDI